jgi:hypothetical protein
MDLSKLSKEEKDRLFADLKAEKQAEEKQKERDREAYKQLKDETARWAFGKLEKLSGTMFITKKEVFGAFGQVIELKDSLYNSKSDRQSDTISTEDGVITIKLGNRVNEGWDDTVEIGVEKVKQYLKTLAKDEESGNLVETIMRLLSKNRKGQLRASKVLELKQLAMKSNSDDFKDAIQIIEDAYRPVPTCQFIEAWKRDENGNEISLPLSMSAIN